MKFIWVTLAALALMVTPAFGQELEDDLDVYGPEQGDWELLLSGAGNSNKEIDAGSFNVSGTLGTYLTDEILVALRQSVGYSDLGGSSNWAGNTRVAADYHFDLGKFRPFIGANVGYVYGDGVNDTWAGGPEAGLKWYLQEEAFVFGRVEYQFFFESSDDVEDNFDDGNFIYTLGIGMNF